MRLKHFTLLLFVFASLTNQADAQNHFLDDFEDKDGRVYFTESVNYLGNGTLFEVKENPDQTGINTSAKCWKFTRGETDPKWAGFWCNLTESFETSKYRYLHVKYYRTNADSRLRIMIKRGSDGVQKEPLPETASSTINAWEYLVYDLHKTDYTNETIVGFGLQPDFYSTAGIVGTTAYIDDIFLSSDLNPEYYALPDDADKIALLPECVKTTGICIEGNPRNFGCWSAMNNIGPVAGDITWKMKVEKSGNYAINSELGATKTGIFHIEINSSVRDLNYPETSGAAYEIQALGNVYLAQGEYNVKLNRSATTNEWHYVNLRSVIFTRIPDYVIEPTETKTYQDYVTGNYGDIIFKSGATSTGQLTGIPAEGLTVNGVVKIEKAFTAREWCPIGFPFDIASVTLDVDNSGTQTAISAWDGTGGDFWLKRYAGTTFGYKTIMSAGEGYVIKFPIAYANLTNQTVTFISNANPVLKNTGTLPVLTDDYTMVANPSVANVSLTTPDIYYLFNGSNDFVPMVSNTTLKPFEALIVKKENIQGGLRSISIEDIETGLNPTQAEPAKVIEVHYYNLQGMEIQEPVKGNVYIVKRLYDSQQTEVTKVRF